MTSAITTFNQTDLNFYPRLRHFLDGENQAKQIVELARDPELSRVKPLYSKWDVTKFFLELPFHFHRRLAIGAYAIGVISEKMGYSKVAAKAKSLGRKYIPFLILTLCAAKISIYICRYYRAKGMMEKAINLGKWSKTTLLHNVADWLQFINHWRFGSKYLTAARNLHREDSYSFYTQSPIPHQKLPHLAKSFSIDKKHGFRFYQQGICLGMCYWFIQLYLQTKGKVHCSTVAHIRAITQLFSKGAGQEESVLQNFQTFKNNGQLWTSTPPHISPLPGKKTYLVSSEAWKKGKTAHLCSMDAHTPYLLHIIMPERAHACVCIKTSKTSGIIFDPNYGALEFSGKDWENQAVGFFYSQRLLLVNIEYIHFVPYGLKR